MKNHIKSESIKERINQLLSTQATTKTALAHAIGMDVSQLSKLLPILFDVPAEGRGEFMTTAQISERLVTYGNIKKPMSVSRLGMLLGQIGYKNVQRRINAIKARGWIVYQRDSEEINSIKKLLAKN